MTEELPDRVSLPLDLAKRVDAICDRFEDGWTGGKQPRIEQYLGKLSEAEQPALLRELLRVELECRFRSGDTPTTEEYQARFPDYSELISQVYREVAESTSHARRSDTDEVAQTATYERPERVAGEVPTARADESEPGAGAFADDPRAAPGQPLPARIGRYRVKGLLGTGGFGTVYLAHDDELDRLIAIKVPHRRRVAGSDDAERYLAEGRAVASLDHPRVVPVYDVGRTDDGSYYVVSKFIEGSDLAKGIKERRPSCRQSAELVAAVADALHHAHLRGLVHRDIKPGNILTDSAGRPYVVDFGLALKEEDFGREAGYAGTLAYMSPEQARGEGHRVDGRADVYSLGVVFYELLTGRRPFRGESPSELLDQIAAVEPRPLRQVDDTVPAELERICLKALSKRASDRYATARDLAEDLRRYLADSAPAGTPPATGSTPQWPPRILAALTAVAATGVCLLGLLTWAVFHAALPRPETPTFSAISEQPDAATERGDRTEPQVAVERATVFVRRGGDDGAMEKLTLQGEGSGPPAPFPPLRPDDDFKLHVELADATHWCLVWIDTNGLVQLVAHSDEPGEIVEYPRGNRLVGVDPSDPAGVHLLALLVSDRPAAEVREELLGRLGDLGPPPDIPLGHYVQLRGSRGPGVTRPTDLNLDPGHSQRLQDRLPDGLHLGCQLYLPTER